MKLRNLIFALFLAIGAIGFTACTGDDGATGPAGPAGPQGPPGESAEPGDPGDSDGVTAYYDFLKSWGSETGEVACDDAILTGEGPLPGPALTPLTPPANTNSIQPNEVGHETNMAVAAVCAASLFDSFTVDLNGDGTPEITGTDDGGQLVFHKTGRATVDDEMEHIAGTEFNKPAIVTTSKKFVGGIVAAHMDTKGGTDEPLERTLLYSNCGVGTAPADIRGMWRAVEITTSKQEYDSNAQPIDANTDTMDIDPQSSTTLVKVCVVLDSTPGVTKCYVNDGAVMDATMDEMIAIYDGSALHPVVPEAMLATDGDSASGLLFEANDLPGVERLCNLFDEGGVVVAN